MLGRSDGTLNPGGVRFGSAEIYQILAELFVAMNDPGMDSLVIGRKIPDFDDDDKVILFIKTSLTWSKDLLSKIQNAIKVQLSPRHVPTYIIQVSSIPYTMNGKKAEVIVKKVLQKGFEKFQTGDLERLAHGLESPDLIRTYRQIGMDLLNSTRN